MEIVRGRILEEDRTRRDLYIRLDELENRAATGDVSLPVEHGRVDIVPPAQCEKFVFLVPVQRGLVAQSLPHRVRVGIDVEVVRVVVDLWLAGDGHGATSLARPPATPAT